MPMEAEDFAEMDSLLTVARKRDLNFAVCMGKKPENTIFYMHRKKDSGILARNAKKAGETAKLAFGTLNLKGKKLNLTCMEDPPSTMARHMKVFLKDQGFAYKVVIMDAFGTVLDSDGEDDEDEDQMEAQEQAEEQAPEVAEDALAEVWNTRVGPLGDLYVEAMKTNPQNRSQLEAAWMMANDKAEAEDYKTAITIADKIEPALKALAQTSEDKAVEDKMKAKFDAAFPQLEQLHAAAVNVQPPPPNLEKLEAAWRMMAQKADEGDFKSALAAAAKLMPALQAAAAGDPESAPWFKLESELSDLYAKAMKNNPPDKTKLQAAWGMATEKAEAKDYRGAINVGERLKPLLLAAAEAKGPTTEIPKNVVAFQKSRVLWSKTRATMFSEMKKLEDAIMSVVGNDPELGELASEVGSLTRRLDAFDEQLETILDDITNSPDGEQRERLKRDAIAKIAEYRTALATDFFKDVDANNGFTTVSVSKAANQSLESISKVLAG